MARAELETLKCVQKPRSTERIGRLVSYELAPLIVGPLVVWALFGWW